MWTSNFTRMFQGLSGHDALKIFGKGGVAREGASNERVVVENGKFQRFRWRFSYTLDMRSALSYIDMQSVVAFPVTQPLLLEN